MLEISKMRGVGEGEDSSFSPWPHRLALALAGSDPAKGTPITSWTTNHRDAVAASTTTSPFAQIFAIMISAGFREVGPAGAQLTVPGYVASVPLAQMAFDE